MTVLGGVVYSHGPVDSDGNGHNDWVLNDNLGAYLAGGALVMTGLALLIGGVTAETHEPDADVQAILRAQRMQPAPARVTFAPPSVAVPTVALPEMPASAQVLRLGQQVRSASMRGDCAGAWIMWQQLNALDVDYAEAVRSGPVMAPCVRGTPAAGTVSTSTMREAPSQRDMAASIDAGVTAR